MEIRSLETLVERRAGRAVDYHALMPRRVRNILLVASPYDSFTFEEDGALSEALFSEYLELNLRYAPSIEKAANADEAIARLGASSFDLVISLTRVGEMDVREFGRRAHEVVPDVPVILLAYDTRELSLLASRQTPGIDRIFVWQGDVRLFLAIIKYVEDRLNAAHDAESAGVKTIILVEDSIRFYSAYLPMLYTEIVAQTQKLMAEGVNRMQQLLRMRARPKILLCDCYEEAHELYQRYRGHVLGVIADARFPREGAVDRQAGFAFGQMVKQDDPNVPVCIQSSERHNEAAAHAMGAAFIDKRSPTLLREVREFMRDFLGFGDFIFRRPDGRVVRRARDLRELLEAVREVPDETLLYHATRNDYSTWLMARTEFDLAKALRPRRADEFGSAQQLRDYLLAALRDYRDETRAGLVAEFTSRSFDLESRFVRIGDGSLGGKGRGLAFMNSLLRTYAIESAVPGVRIFIPPTVVLATGVFDQFMHDADLTRVALGDHDDARIRAAFLDAELPPTTRDALRTFLERVDYPLAVRSSSLLEDSSFQPFAGVYETYMLPNNHPDLEVRLDELSRAVRLVYASTYYVDSRSYIESTPNRLEEEKMAVVIQQIVGRRHEQYVYPDLAGVARSYDYYPMEEMAAEDGVASVALGLGRTVVEGGRCVRFSPAQPQKLYQFATPRDYLDGTQREFFALDLGRSASGGDPLERPDANLTVLDLEAAERHETLGPVGSVYSPENEVVYEGISRPGVKLISMAGVLSGSYFDLPRTLRFLLDLGQAGFSCHVEMEFAVQLRQRPDDPHEFAFLQIRPLVFGATGRDIDFGEVPREATICHTDMALGHGRFEDVRDLVYVRPDTFERSQTRAVAAEIGALNAELREAGRPYVLIGFGRWGSADPWLGIPVGWSQISGVRCIVEADLQDISVAPSQGTHFFQNLTSFGLGYFTVHTRDDRDFLDLPWLAAQPAQQASEHLRHLRFAEPLEIVVDGRSGRGVIMKPGEQLPI
ncbi:MAG: histidine kinase [Candidatus Eisenbacteria bacterium]|nr:histidine kinase [Candidatus Eisenbacteria bacterium]